MHGSSINQPANNAANYTIEIFAIGLRNPWRFSFDRLTGDLWLGDFGQDSWEEIDYQKAPDPGGENYGWNVMEGNSCYSVSNCNPALYTPPIWVYAHVSNLCAVTGGYVYRGQAYPGLQGIYIYGDYCSGNIWGLRQENGVWTNNQFLSSGHSISTFGEDEAGELYLADVSTGVIYKLVQTP